MSQIVTFRGGNADIITADEPEIIAEGAAGTGKSIAAGYRLLLDAEEYPGCRIAVVRKTRASLTESFMVSFEEKVLQRGHPVLGAGGKRSHRHSYDFPNGSTIVPLGMDNPDRLYSTEWDRIYCNEVNELRPDEYDSLDRSLRNDRTPHPIKIADLNPQHPRHWAKARIDSGKLRHIQTEHVDNPFLYTADGYLTKAGRQYMTRLSNLTGFLRDRLYLGKWTAAEGLVYDTFHPSTHVCDPFDIPEDWRRFRVVDWGFNDPFVCQWWAVKDDVMYLYREIYQTGTLVEDMADKILELSKDEKIDATICDHDAGNRATFDAAGIPNILAFKDIMSGINNVKSRLEVKGNGKPRIVLMKNALVETDKKLLAGSKPTSTEDEFAMYAWKKTKEGTDKDQPDDLVNHGLVCVSYGSAGIDSLGSSPVSVSVLGSDDDYDDDDFDDSSGW